MISTLNSRRRACFNQRLRRAIVPHALALALFACWSVVGTSSGHAQPPEIAPSGQQPSQGNNVQRLYHDRQGVLWVGTQDSIERLTPEGQEALPAVGGVSQEIVAPFAEDGSGGMFFVTSGGLFLWSKGSVHRIVLELASGDAAVAIYHDPQQRIWLGTRTGVYQLKPRKDPPASSPDGVAYDAVLRANVHGAVTALTGDAAGSLWIGTSSDGLWRLDANGLVRATRGDVEARGIANEAGDVNAATARKSKSSFYEMWIFYAVLAIVGVFVAAYLLRRRMQLMTGRLGIVLEERNRIASECHDTLMAGFAAISWQLEATAKLFKDSGSEATPAAKSCDLARSMVSHCQAEARRIIWDLRDTGEVTDVLSQALSRALSASHLQASIETTLDVEGDEVHLAPGCVHHLVCIGLEAVSNAIRHAQPSQIVVNLRYDIDALALSIRDNGNGFVPSIRSVSPRGHFGIPVMEERARKLGGSFRIQTTVGGGTEVLVKVAFNAMQQPVNQQHHVIRWIGI
ncbi:MAG: two-component regulator propeller domain-containing protein [Edaphobacter sp.]|uniref:sensor histidine kinase n=1 Tax=Edaphobacter sp. TaxID=1934404 RepID=UPI0023887421|nr:two-component regulator propeller domain-containing protein [Edaphobacter sp.]MDE1177292.1 two-component regulator propeller domain-containing protein [Edaphobacter sp.]